MAKLNKEAGRPDQLAKLDPSGKTKSGIKAERSTKAEQSTKVVPSTSPARRQIIKDPIYRGDGFYNTDDIVQAKYEMLRRVVISGWPVGKVAELFGVSRQSFYQTLATFESQGMAGLMPKPRGRRRSSLKLPEQYY